VKLRTLTLLVLLALLLSACTVTPALPSLAAVDTGEVASFEEAPCPFGTPWWWRCTPLAPILKHQTGHLG